MYVKTLHIGLGPIRTAVVKQCAISRGFTIVGAVDIDPAKVGRDLGEVVGYTKKLKVSVSDDIAKAIKATKPDVAILCTSSALMKVMPQIEAVLKLKVPIVSTTEEFACPTGKNKMLAKKAKVIACSPGLHTMRSLPIPSWFGGK